MDLSVFWSAGNFVHLALLFYVFGFMVRDELWLRVLILAGTSFYIAYYYFASATPLWDAIFASCVIGLVNITMILIILRERSTIGMSPEMLSLFQSFPTLSPGQFRRIMRVSARRITDSEEVICRQGEVPENLYYLVSGVMRLTRDHETVDSRAGSFIGEISFLLERGASATVSVGKGAEYVAWPRAELRRMMARSPSLSNALAALFNRDLAGKLSNSMPR